MVMLQVVATGDENSSDRVYLVDDFAALDGITQQLLSPVQNAGKCCFTICSKKIIFFLIGVEENKVSLVNMLATAFRPH